MKKTYYISGMHCKACELLVKKTCEDECDCIIDKANHKDGSISVTWTDGVDEAGLQDAIQSCGYKVTKSPGKNMVTIMPLKDRIAFLLGAFIFTFILIKVDVISFMSSMQADNSLGVIFLLGLVASVSTCLAVTGGVVIGFTELVDKTKDKWGDIKLHGGFQLGRIVGFFIFGSILGYLSNIISVSFGFASWLNIIISVVFIYLGLQMLNIVPSMSDWGIYIPEKRSKRILSQNNPYLAPIVGALTFFLPCGFTQSVQLMALASGSWLLGGSMMAVFALGTLPGLLALGMGTSFAKDNRKYGFEKIIAMILLIFGLFTLWGTASIWGWTDMVSIQKNTQEVSQGDGDKSDLKDAIVGDDSPLITEKIILSHNGYQLVPETTILKAGGNYEITITPTQNGIGCMSTITFPRIDKTVHYVRQGEPITYTITDAQPGQLSFVCASMGMSQGKVIVE